MSNDNTHRVRIKSTGKVITVYELLLGGYCDAKNHTTSYAKDNLEFLNDDDIEQIDNYRTSSKYNNNNNDND